MSSEHESLQKELAEARTELKSLRASVESAEKERDAFQARVREMEEAESKRVAELKDLRTQLTASTKRAESATHQNAGLKEDNAGLLSTLEDVRSQVETFTEERTNLQQELEAGRQQLQAAQVSDTEAKDSGLADAFGSDRG